MAESKISALMNPILEVSTGVTGVHAKKCGHLVMLNIYKAITASSEGWYEIGALPSSIAPVKTLNFTGYDDTVFSFENSKILLIKIDTTNNKLYCYVFPDRKSFTLISTFTYLSN